MSLGNKRCYRYGLVTEVVVCPPPKKPNSVMSGPACQHLALKNVPKLGGKGVFLPHPGRSDTAHPLAAGPLRASRRRPPRQGRAERKPRSFCPRSPGEARQPPAGSSPQPPQSPTRRRPSGLRAAGPRRDAGTKLPLPVPLSRGSCQGKSRSSIPATGKVQKKKTTSFSKKN